MPKTFDRMQHPSTIQTLNEQEVEMHFLNLIKFTCKTLTGNITLIRERMKAFPVRNVTRMSALTNSTTL